MSREASVPVGNGRLGRMMPKGTAGKGRQARWVQLAKPDDAERGEPPFWGRVAQLDDVERDGHVRRGELFDSIMSGEAFVWV